MYTKVTKQTQATSVYTSYSWGLTYLAFTRAYVEGLYVEIVIQMVCYPQVEQSKVLMKEGGVQLLLTIVDTPGFGDAVDNSNWWEWF